MIKNILSMLCFFFTKRVRKSVPTSLIEQPAVAHREPTGPIMSKRVRKYKPVCAITWKRSPNQSTRNGKKPEFIILHHTGSDSFNGGVSWLCQKRAKASAHFIVDRVFQSNGTVKVVQLVKIDRKAWHAGRAYWKGDRNINAKSIGIEMVSKGKYFTKAHYEATAELCAKYMKLYDIPEEKILGHYQVSPKRKWDPGTPPKGDWNWAKFSKLLKKKLKKMP